MIRAVVALRRCEQTSVAAGRPDPRQQRRAWRVGQVPPVTADPRFSAADRAPAEHPRRGCTPAAAITTAVALGYQPGACPRSVSTPRHAHCGGTGTARLAGIVRHRYRLDLDAREHRPVQRSMSLRSTPAPNARCTPSLYPGSHRLVPKRPAPPCPRRWRDRCARGSPRSPSTAPEPPRVVPAAGASRPPRTRSRS